MDTNLKRIVLEIVSNFNSPLTFNSLYSIINANYKTNMKQLKECVKTLENENLLEIVDDLYKYRSNKEFNESKIYSTDYCIMNIQHKWNLFSFQIA